MLVPWFHNEFRAILNAGLLHGLLDSEPFHAFHIMRDWMRFDRRVNLDTKHTQMVSEQDFLSFTRFDARWHRTLYSFFKSYTNKRTALFRDMYTTEWE